VAAFGIASILGAIVLMAACSGTDEVAQTRAEASTSGAQVVQTEGDDFEDAATGPRRLRRELGHLCRQRRRIRIGLTTSPAREYDPSWSPDGRKIAYRYQPGEDEAEAEIYVMNADGSGKRNLTRSPGQDHSPAWSPDGSKISFASTRGGLLPHIWLMNADGSSPTRVTTTVGGEYPAWSPDGRTIAFDVNTDVEPNIDPGSAAGFDIFVINADGSGLRRLTNAPAEDQGASWSSDGTWIIYHRSRLWRGPREALDDELGRIGAKAAHRSRRLPTHLVTRWLEDPLLGERALRGQAGWIGLESAADPRSRQYGLRRLDRVGVHTRRARRSSWRCLAIGARSGRANGCATATPPLAPPPRTPRLVKIAVALALPVHTGSRRG
jgi:dipeptidyl aminopeptidase/acylaminoacyl peptidase